MTSQPVISVIVPTIGRPESLTRLFASLLSQTHPVAEVLVADGSSDQSAVAVVASPRWAEAGLAVRHIGVAPPNAVRQRQAAIAAANGDLLLLLDDDVELEPNCVDKLVEALDSEPGAVAVMADFNNQSWAMPTRAWRIYLRMIHGLHEGEWQGRVVGPLLRYGFSPSPRETRLCEWLGSGNSLVRRSAFERAGGFSDFFLHRSTMNEDVDLALRLSRQGSILFSPHAKLGHFHDPAGRVSPQQVAEDDLFNRFHVLNRTCGRSRLDALRLVLAFATIESASNVAGSLLRRRWGQTGSLMRGRLSALGRILGATGPHDSHSQAGRAPAL